MNKKNRGNLLEQHAEKIVLGVAGIISVGLLWMFVLSSPNSEKIGGEKYGPGEIDRYIKGQADQLEAALVSDPVEKEELPPDAMRKLFNRKIVCAIEEVPDFAIPGPAPNRNFAKEDRLYAVPDVGTLDKVAVEVIRGAAHVPLDEVGLENAYARGMTQLEDIDLVTVQASFDIGALYRNFTQSFVMGRGVKNDWKDDELAAPVFASAQLQRRRALEGGGWSEWEVIPRSKIDEHRTMLSDPEKIDFDISVQKTRFKPFEIQRSVLQPKPYNFASSNAVWLAPSFHKEYVKIVKREKKQTVLDERERLRNEQSRDRGRSVMGNEGTRGRNRTSRGGAYPNEGESAYGSRSRTRTTRQPLRGRRTTDARRGREMMEGSGDYYDGGYDPEMGLDYQRRQPQEGTLDSVIAENRKVMIYDEQQLQNMKDPLVFWAHDDTIEPGNTYQYKIRLGVFNPIAGKSWFYPEEEQYKEQVVLWSEFAEIDEDVEIVPMIYFFPTGVVKTAEKKVKIDVFKYHYGNWKTETFDVHPGEMIGKTVDSKEETSVASARDAYAYEVMGYDGGIAATTVPETIDFDTGAMLVDVIRTDAWTGPRPLVRARIADVLYTRDGVNMIHFPVKRSNWTSAMKGQYAKVDEASKESVEIQQANAQNKVDLFGRQRGISYPRGRGGRGEYDMEGGDYMDSRSDRYRGAY